MTTDVSSFINSKDIRKYLKDSGYEFSSLEAAWIILRSMDRTWEEKKNAWTNLFREMPDCEIPEHINCRYKISLHRYLREYVTVIDQQYTEFLASDSDCVYSYRVHYYGDKSWAIDYCNTAVFRDCQSCLNAAEEFIKTIPFETEEDLLELDADIEIRRQSLSDSKQEYHVLLNRNGEFLTISKRILSSEEKEILEDSFENLWFAFPVPFKKGDILEELKDRRFPGRRFAGGPFVLTKVASWDADNRSADQRDDTDMTVSGHFLNEDGTVYDEVMDNYMDCEYYCGPLDGKNRILKALSCFEKGTISLELLLLAYKKNLLMLAAEDPAVGMFTEEVLNLAGISKNIN